MHDNNTLHLDIKPSNILVHNDEPYLADFGCAIGTNFLSSRTLIGTLGFMAPEVSRVNQETIHSVY